MNIFTYDPTEAVKAQEAYCDEHEFPIFAPSNGWCVNCGRNIFEAYTYRGCEDQTTGISVQEAKTRLITCCPHCNTTFCD